MQQNVYKRYILLVLFFVAILQIPYIFLTNQYPIWDEHQYLSLAIQYRDSFIKGIQFPELATLSRHRQPFFSLCITLFTMIFGTSYIYKISLLLNVVFHMASTVGVYRLASRFYQRGIAIISALLFIGTGNALFYTHFAYTETAVSALIIWCLVFLYESDGLRNRKASIFAGILFAIAALTRWVAPVYLFGGLVFVIYTFLRHIYTQKQNIRKLFITALICFTIGIVLPIGIYFVPNWQAFISYVNANQTQGVQWVQQYRDPSLANTFSIRSLMFYFNIISQNTVYYMIFLLIGTFIALWRFKKYAFLLLNSAIPYGFFTFVTIWKEDRFLVPIYPILAVIAAASFTIFKRKIVKWIIFAIVAIFSFSIVFSSLYGLGPFGAKGLYDIVLPSFIHHPRRIYLTPMVWKPVPEQLNMDLIAKAIQNDWTGSQKPKIFQAFRYEPINNASLSVFTYYYPRTVDYFIVRPKINAEGLLRELQQSDYILVKTGNISDQLSNSDSNVLTHVLYDFPRGTIIASIPIPMDNSIITVYRRISN